MKTVERNKIMIQCDCAGEILVVEAEAEMHGNIRRIDFNLAIFAHGAYAEKPNLWYRIKYAWNHLLTGKIYSDYMLLEEKKAEALAKFIKENIEIGHPTSI